MCLNVAGIIYVEKVVSVFKWSGTFFVHGGAAPDGEGGKGRSHVIVQQQQSVTSLAVIQCQLGVL